MVAAGPHGSNSLHNGNVTHSGRESPVNTDKNTNQKTAEDPPQDFEMQAIGYPPPADQASFGRRLAEIIQRALRRQKPS